MTKKHSAIFPAAILAQHIAVLGKTGSGKTSTAKLAIEQLAGEGNRVCILDPIKSDYWGLTSSESGKQAGLPFRILGGPHGHVPLHQAAGKAIAEVVAAGSLPLSILDMANFRPGGTSGFFVDFAETLLRKMRGVLHLVLEEAHLFAPKERSGIGAENMAIHWAKTLATAGRSKGIRLVLVTQRTQALHNALLGSCDTLIVHRLTAPADQSPALKWLSANTSKEVATQVEASLSSLATGEAWLCSGEAQIFERRKFPRIATFDNTATPTSGGKVQRVKTAAVDVDQLKAIVGEAIEEAKANDPAELKKRIVDLEKQLKQQAKGIAAPAAKTDQSSMDRAIERAIGERDRHWQNEIKTRDRQWEENGRKQIAAERELRKRLAKIAELAGVSEKTVDEKPATLPELVQPRPFEREKTAPARGLSSRPAANPSNLGAGELKVLTAIAQHEGGVTREQITVLTAYKASSRNTYLQRLSQRGLIETGPIITVTEEGLAALGDDFEPLPTGDALRDYWLSSLGEGEAKILALICAAYPDAISREALGDATGYKPSSRNTYLQRLSQRRIVDSLPGGLVRASGHLFD